MQLGIILKYTVDLFTAERQIPYFWIKHIFEIQITLEMLCEQRLPKRSFSMDFLRFLYRFCVQNEVFKNRAYYN